MRCFVINLSGVQSREGIVKALEKLQFELTKAAHAGAVDQEAAADANTQLNEAVLQAKQPSPNKKTLLAHLGSAKDLIESVTKGISAANGLITAPR